MEVILEIVVELLLQLFGEALVVMIQAAFSKGERKLGPVGATIAIALAGAVIGLASVVVWPRPMVTDVRLRVLNLVVSPLIAAVAVTGAARRRAGAEQRRLTFLNAWLFASTLSLVRFIGTWS